MKNLWKGVSIISVWGSIALMVYFVKTTDCKVAIAYVYSIIATIPTLTIIFIGD